jgi:hypothetical protein
MILIIPKKPLFSLENIMQWKNCCECKRFEISNLVLFCYFLLYLFRGSKRTCSDENRAETSYARGPSLEYCEVLIGGGIIMVFIIGAYRWRDSFFWLTGFVDVSHFVLTRY